MSILQLTTVLPGQVGIYPADKRMVTTADLTTVTTAGYLNAENLQGQTIQNGDKIETYYSYNEQTSASSYAIFIASVTNGVITLSSWTNPGNVSVTLPVVANNFPVFFGTSGNIGDSGLAPSDTLLQKFVVTNPGSMTVGNVPIFSAVNGTTSDQRALTDATNTYKIVTSNGGMNPGDLLKCADANGTVASAGFRVKAGLTTAYSGGGTSHAFVALGLNSGSNVVATMASNTNAVAISTVVPATDQITVTFTGDPGANTTVYYIAI